MQCSVVAGDLPLNILWKFNNANIDSVKGITVGSANRRSSTISIESVSYEHAGNYTCVVENKVGKTEQTAALNVNGQ